SCLFIVARTSGIACRVSSCATLCVASTSHRLRETRIRTYDRMTLTTKNPMAASSTAHSQRFCTPRLPSVASSERIIHSPFSYLRRRGPKPGVGLDASLPARPARGSPLGEREQDQVVTRVQIPHRQPGPHA